MNGPRVWGLPVTGVPRRCPPVESVLVKEKGRSQKENHDGPGAKIPAKLYFDEENAVSSV